MRDDFDFLHDEIFQPEFNTSNEIPNKSHI